MEQAKALLADEDPGVAPADLGDRRQQLRLLEALLFAAAEPLDEETLAARMPDGADIPGLLGELGDVYANRGIRLVKAGKTWALRTAPDLAPYLKIETEVRRRLSQAAVETLAIIAYHQPVTRAEIEEVRGRSLSRGTLDVLLEAGWIRPKGRRRTPGRPVTWGTTEAFLDQFGLESLDDLPGLDELKASGLLDTRPAIAAYGAPDQGGGADSDRDEDEADEEGPDEPGKEAGEGTESPDRLDETGEAAPLPGPRPVAEND